MQCCAHCGVEIVERKRFQLATSFEIATRLERIGEINDLIQTRRIGRTQSVRSYRRKHTFIAHTELLASELRAETCVQNRWVRALERVYRKMPRLAFCQQSLR